MAARLFFIYFFPCSADHERDWPPCKVVFFGLATNALNVRNNNRGVPVVGIFEKGHTTRSSPQSKQYARKPHVQSDY